MAMIDANAFMDRQQLFVEHPEWRVRVFNYIFRRRKNFSQVPQISTDALYQKYEVMRDMIQTMFAESSMKRLAQMASYYFCVTTGLQSELASANEELKRLRVVVALNKMEFPQEAEKTFFDTILTIDDGGTRLTHSNVSENMVKIVLDGDKFSLYIPKLKKYVDTVDDKCLITLSDERTMLGSIVKNNDGTISLKVSSPTRKNNYISARRDGKCAFMENNLAWEHFKHVFEI